MNRVPAALVCLGLSLLMMLTGCKSTAPSPETGNLDDGETGDVLTLSPKVTVGWQDYLKKTGQQYFFISKDGQTSGWSTCSNPNCPGSIQRAREYCEFGNRECAMFAEGTRIVWDGAFVSAPWLL